MSFTISDIEKMGKLSGLLVIPLIAAALYTEFGLWVVGSILRYLYLDNYFAHLFSNILVFSLSVVIVALAYSFVNGSIASYKWFRLVLGLTLLTYGVLGLGVVLEVVSGASSGDSTSYGNLYTHLAALAWGFQIFNIGERSTNQKNQPDA